MVKMQDKIDFINSLDKEMKFIVDNDTPMFLSASTVSSYFSFYSDFVKKTVDDMINWNKTIKVFVEKNFEKKNFYSDMISIKKQEDKILEKDFYDIYYNAWLNQTKDKDLFAFFNKKIYPFLKDFANLHDSLYASLLEENYSSGLDFVYSTAMRNAFKELDKIKEEPLVEKNEVPAKVKKPIIIDENYFVGYKINEKENADFDYEIDDEGRPVKVYFSPKDFSKILTTHMLITGKTGTGKTSFNNQLIHTLLYHGISVFAFDFKDASIDYSATIINKEEPKSRFLQEMNNPRYKGSFSSLKFTEQDIPNSTIKIINPEESNFQNRFGNKVVPLVIYNNPDEVENIEYFTPINIFDNELRTKLIEISSNKKSKEYLATRLKYKEGIEKILLLYFRFLGKEIESSTKKFIDILSNSMTEKSIDFMEENDFKSFPKNEEFSEWLKDNTIFGKKLKANSPEQKFINAVHESNYVKKIIDFENGVNLYSIMKSIIFDMKTNFYLTIKTNSNLAGFYVVYLYNLLLSGEKFKLEGLEDNSTYTAVFIDETYYLAQQDKLVEKTILDAEKTDRFRNRAWILASQRVFFESFKLQESIGNYVMFSPQATDISLQKSRFSETFEKDILDFVGTQNFTMTFVNPSLFIDSNGKYINPKTTVIKSFPNRAWISDIMEYGLKRYGENVKKYLITNFKLKE